MPRDLSGVLPCILLPYHESFEIDVDSFRRQVDYIYEVGSNGFVIGQVSELMRLSTMERYSVAELAVTANAGRGCVVMSTGAESTKVAVEYSKQAQSVGVDCLLVMHPSTTALTDEQMFAYFGTVIESVDIPVMVHSTKSYAKLQLSQQVAARLLERYGANKVLFKPECAPTPPKLSLLRDLTSGQARVFEGDGGMVLLDAYQRGIVGTIPAADTAAVHVCLWRLLQRDQQESAYPIAYALSYLMCIMMNSGDCYQTLGKHTLRRLGVMRNELVRPPLDYVPDRETLAEVDRTYDHMMSLVERSVRP